MPRVRWRCVSMPPEALALATFVNQVRRRRIWHDVAIAAIAGAICATLAALLIVTLASAFEIAAGRGSASTAWLTAGRIIIATIIAAVGGVTLLLMRRAPTWQD